MILTLPWALLSREHLVEIRADIHRYPTMSSGEIEARMQAAVQRRSNASRPSGIAVIPINGPIMPKADLMGEIFGWTSIEGIRANLRAALADPDVGGIVLDVDSPGGYVYQTPELADEIRAARSVKPIVAAVSGIAASGAYWLAAQASEIVVTPSGAAGSIGVFIPHEDVSLAMEQEGVKVTLISAGKYKTEGNPFEPLTDEARAYIQGMTDDYYAMFVKGVAAGRNAKVGEVRDGYGQGRMLLAKDAVAAGLADRVGTFEDAVGRVSSSRAMLPAAAVEPEPVMVAEEPSGPPHEFYRLRARRRGRYIPA